jgi:hypothetical protein
MVMRVLPWLAAGFDNIEPQIGYDNVLNKYFNEYLPRAVSAPAACPSWAHGMDQCLWCPAA